VEFEALLDLSALVFAALVTGAVRRLALSHGFLDLPNERSSHDKATPQGGGASIVFVVSAAALVLASRAMLDTHLAAVLLVGGVAVATVGFLDDREPLPVSIRLVVHLAAAIWAVIWLGGLPSLKIGDQVVRLGWAGDALAVLGIVWTLNLFNFMDGIDGIAAGEAVFVALAGALMSVLGRGAADEINITMVFAAGCAGFLLWNWPPAKIFMGDVGSGYLGYVIAVLALFAARTDPVAIWVWLILGGVFFVDATVTLLRRLLRGELVYQPHRSHAYQWLARRWGSHAKATCAILTVNVLWLLPCAVLATRHPGWAAPAVLFAYAPLLLFALVVSGRRDANSRRAS
jgi:Fuc2NAc and GlcNAc transferase